MHAPNRNAIPLPAIILISTIVAFCALMVVSSIARAEDRPMRLTLLHNNDGESKLATGDSKAGYGGAARFKTVTDRLRAAADARVTNSQISGAAGKGTLMVSSGDNFLAGLALLKGFNDGPPWPDAIAINGIDYDAMTLGNHEFDFGQARLAEFISGVDSDVPFISANLGFNDTIPALRSLAGNRIKRSVIVGSGSERVGVIGLTTADIAGISSPGNVRIEADLAAAVNREVGRLHREGVNKIIVSAHLQAIANDEALIPLVRGVDVWIAGGGDDLLADPDDTLIPGDTSVGSYPKQVLDSTGAPVQIVSTAGEYKYVGRLSIDFSARGTIRSIDQTRSGPVRVSGTLADADYAPEDAAIKTNAVDPVAAFSAGLASQPVGSSEVALQRTKSGSPTNDPIRRRQSGFGDLVADSYLWKARQLVAGNPQIDTPQVAIANGGGIRADIPVGPINKAQTFATLPFFNQISVVEDIEREELRQLLERAYSGLPGITGQFANISGMRVEVDASFPAQVISAAPAPVTIVTPGQRVRNLWLDNGTPSNTADDTQLIASGVAVAGPSIDLATVDFTAKDGDRYPFSAQGLVPLNVGSIYNQALEDFIAAPTNVGGLGGVVTAARYPAVPTGVRRITIAGD